MYCIKQKPEDFIVKEKINYELKEKGGYTYFWLTKKNYNTLKALQQISKITNRPFKNFSFAGNKDRQAITTQLCSIKGEIKKIKMKDIEIKIIGKADKPVSLGTLEGNDFEIIVRNIEKMPEIKTKFVNYFGEQRFSTNNAEIGKAIIKKQWITAIELINDDKINKFLETNQNNFASSLKQIPLKLLRMYINSYQSYLWNKLAEKYKNSKENIFLPLIGFGTKITKNVKELLEEEKITTRDFIIKEIPELSSEGTERYVFSEAENLEISDLEADELNSGKKKILLKFFLPKGSYATEFIRQNFN